MDRGKAGLTVFFEGPFWVGVFERVEDGKLSVCRVVFGSEPRDYEVWELILKNYYGCEGWQGEPEAEAEGGRETDHAGRDRYEVPAGAAVAEGREEDGAQAGRQGAEGGREAADV